jgi:hypothetical protein
MHQLKIKAMYGMASNHTLLLKLFVEIITDV